MRQGGDKCKLMRPKEPRVGDKGETSVGDKCGRQVWGQVGERCKLMRPKAPESETRGRQGVNSCGPRNPEWETSVHETSVGDKCGRQVGDMCKLMRPEAPRVRDKCGRQGGDKCKLMRPKEPRVGDKGETSVNSCGPRHPEWETRGRQV